MKKLFKLSRKGWADPSAVSEVVVCAYSEQQAREMHPSGRYIWNPEKKVWLRTTDLTTTDHSWVAPEDVHVLEIGNAHNFLRLGPVVVDFVKP